jgi:hypothetical protein
MRQVVAAMLALAALACAPASAGAAAGHGKAAVQWLDIDLAGSNGY